MRNTPVQSTACDEQEATELIAAGFPLRDREIEKKRRPSMAIGDLLP